MGKIFCIMGKSASGKDTLYQRILAERPELHTYVMYSTRPIRAGEQDGVSYHFVKEEALLEFQIQGRLIEKRTYQTVCGPWSYATVDDGQIDLCEGDYLMPATLESYLQLRSYYGRDRLVPFYLEVDDGERLMRAVHREMGQEHPNFREVCRRFLADEEDFSEEKRREAGFGKCYRDDLIESCPREIIGEIRRQEEK